MTQRYLRILILGMAWGAGTMIFQSLARVLFVRLFASGPIESTELTRAMVMGARFDASIVGYALIFYLLVGTILQWGPGSAWPRRTLLALFFVVLALNAGDLSFFSYFHDHYNIRVFELFRDDTWAIWLTTWRDQPVIKTILFTAVTLYGTNRGLQSVDRRLVSWSSSVHIRPLFFSLFWVLIPLVTLFFMGRGTLILKMPPLGRMHIDVSQDPFVNQIAYNPVMAFVDTMKKASSRSASFDLVQQMGYTGRVLDAYRLALNAPELSSLEEARARYWKVPVAKHRSEIPPHVVVFLMESMGSFWLDFDSPSFPILGGLERHFQEDGLRRRFLPNCMGTYCTLAYMLMNAPTLPGPNLTEARALPSEFPSGVAQPFRRAGYRTLFVYGGALGWRDLANLVPKMGFDELAGSAQIKKALGERQYFEHDWGIQDEHVLDFVQQELRGSSKPTFVFVLTTSNHPPFNVPKTFDGMPFGEIPSGLKERVSISPEKFNARMRCYQYANRQLAKFMDAVKNSGLKDKTVVAITGDHNFFDVTTFAPEEFLDWKGVPFYLYVPTSAKPRWNLEVWSAQDEIFPTLYELAIPDQPALYFGQSLLAKDRVNRAINSEGLIQDSLLLLQGRVLRQKSPGHRFETTNDPEDLEKGKKLGLWLRAHYTAVYDSLLNPPPKP